MTNELDSVKRKIRAIAQMTTENGASEAEAMQAMARVGKLLEQFNLGMDEVFIQETQCVIHLVDPNRTQRSPLDTVIAGLAGFCDLKVWKNGNGGYKVFGFPEDTEMFEYLYRVIHSAFEQEYARYRNTPEYQASTQHGRSKRSSFAKGMSSRLNARLKEIKKEMQDQRYRAEEVLRKDSEGFQIGVSDAARVAVANATTGTALILLKTAKVEEELAKMKMRFRTYSYRSRIRDTNAYYSGQKAGDKVNLSRPLGGQNKPLGITG